MSDEQQLPNSDSTVPCADDAFRESTHLEPACRLAVRQVSATPCKVPELIDAAIADTDMACREAMRFLRPRPGAVLALGNAPAKERMRS
jgi:hypothetical protein